MLELSAEQERARTAILNWYRSSDRKPLFYLAGYAGSGKSSTITAVTESIKGTILYAAPTGKAALVMARKGCTGARTLHSLIYTPGGMSGNREQVEKLRELRNDPTRSDLRTELLAEFKAEIDTLAQLSLDQNEAEKADNTRRKLLLQTALKTNLANIKELVSVNPIFQLNEESAVKDAKLLVIDEISMCNKDTVADAISFGVPILAMGDPGQLAPIRGESYLGDLKPDFFLSEIHRQAKESPIIYLATLARQGKRLPLGDHGNCKVSRFITEEEAMGVDQIIVGRHVTRWATNDKVRGLLGYSGILPNPGEKVICRNNNRELGLLNGDMFTTVSCSPAPRWDDKRQGQWNDNFHKCFIRVKNETTSVAVKAHMDYFLPDERDPMRRQEPNPYLKKNAECFDLGHAITCHSAQGSQWDSVFIRDESTYFRGQEANWLYTAVTRAAERVVVRV